MSNEAREELRVRLKLVVLEFANQFGVTKTCMEITRPSFIILLLEIEIRE